LGGPMKFEVKQLRKGSLQGATPVVASAFAKTYEKARAEQRMQAKRFGELEEDVKKLHEAVLRSEEKDIDPVMPTILGLKRDIEAMKVTLYGQPSRSKIGEKTNPTVNSRLGETRRAFNSTYGPTGTAKTNLALIQKEQEENEKVLSKMETTLAKLKEDTKSWSMPRF